MMSLVSVFPGLVWGGWRGVLTVLGRSVDHVWGSGDGEGLAAVVGEGGGRPGGCEDVEERVRELCDRGVFLGWMRKVSWLFCRTVYGEEGY